MSASFPLGDSPRDVPLKALEPYIHIATQHGQCIADLLEGTELSVSDLDRPTIKLTWDEHCLIGDRVCEIVGGLKDFEACGQTMIRGTVTSNFDEAGSAGGESSDALPDCL